MERLQRKFALIHATLAQQNAMSAAGGARGGNDYAERLSLMSLAENASITSLGAKLKASGSMRRALGGQGGGSGGELSPRGSYGSLAGAGAGAGTSHAGEAAQGRGGKATSGMDALKAAAMGLRSQAVAAKEVLSAGAGPSKQ